MFIKNIKSNVKCGFTHELGPCTLIIGENRAGKSSVIDALSLALTGQAHSEGIGKREVDILALAKDGTGPLTSEVVFDSGEVAQYECHGTTAKASRAKRTGPAGVLVAEEARALLQGDPKRLRAAMLEKIGGKISLEEIGLRFPAGPVRDLWTEFLKTGAGEKGILEIKEALGRMARRIQAEAKELEASVALPCSPLTDGEKDELRVLQGLSAEGISIEAREGLQTRIQELTAKKRWLEEQTKESRGSIDMSSYGDLKALQAAQVALQRLTGGKDCNCPMCGSRATSGDFAARAKSLESALANLEQRAAEHRSYASLLAQVERVDAELHEKMVAYRSSVGVDTDRLRELADRDRKARAQAEATARLPEVLQAASAGKALGDVLDETISLTIDRATESFEQSLNAHMPKGQKARLVLRDGDREVFRLEVKTRGTYVDFRALSGAERAGLVTAFAAATANGTDTNVLVIDEVWLDGKSLRAVMDSARNAVVRNGGVDQAILSVVSFKGKVPDGWTEIRL